MNVDKDLFIILGGRILQVIIAVLSIRVVTSLLVPEQMGNVYLFLTVQTFFVFALISPVGQFINRKTHAWEREKNIVDNLFSFLVYVIAISIFSILVVFVLYTELEMLNGIPLGVVLIFIPAFIVVMTMNQTVIPMLNMLHHRISFTVLTVLTSAGALLLGFILIKQYQVADISWLEGILISNFIFALIGYYTLRNKLGEGFGGISFFKQSCTLGNIRPILKLVIPISFATLFMWAQNSGYRIIIEQKLGLAFLGYLGVGLAIAMQIASTVESIVSQYLSPIYYRDIADRDATGRAKVFNEYLNTALPVYLLLALYVSFLAPYIVDILVDKTYEKVYIFVIFGIWVEFFRMVANLFYAVSLSEFKTRKIMLPYVFGSIVTILGVYVTTENVNPEFFIPILLVAGGGVTMVSMYFSMLKLLPFEVDYKMLLISVFASLPYGFIYYFGEIIEGIYLSSYVVVLFSGLYFLGTVFVLQKKIVRIRRA